MKEEHQVVVIYNQTNAKKLLEINGFKEFREFDYGLDIESNIILVQDEISQGMVFVLNLKS